MPTVDTAEEKWERPLEFLWSTGISGCYP